MQSIYRTNQCVRESSAAYSQDLFAWPLILLFSWRCGQIGRLSVFSIQCRPGDKICVTVCKGAVGSALNQRAILPPQHQNYTEGRLPPSCQSRNQPDRRLASDSSMLSLNSACLHPTRQEYSQAAYQSHRKGGKSPPRMPSNPRQNEVAGYPLWIPCPQNNVLQPV